MLRVTVCLHLLLLYLPLAQALGKIKISANFHKAETMLKRGLWIQYFACSKQHILLLQLTQYVNYIHISNRKRKERLVIKEKLGCRRDYLSFHSMQCTVQLLFQHPFNFQIRRIISILPSSFLLLPSETLL